MNRVTGCQCQGSEVILQRTIKRASNHANKNPNGVFDLQMTHMYADLINDASTKFGANFISRLKTGDASVWQLLSTHEVLVCEQCALKDACERL